jgi:hypothetical protein
MICQKRKNSSSSDAASDDPVEVLLQSSSVSSSEDESAKDGKRGRNAFLGCDSISVVESQNDPTRTKDISNLPRNNAVLMLDECCYCT